MKHIIVIGAGPAGLTAAYELLSRSDDVRVTVFEESSCFGGISKTVCHNGNRMDMGGHRFFSKVPEVNAWWARMMPDQGAPSKDDKILHRKGTLAKGGPDPEVTDRVMLKRHRVSRIFYNNKFFDYPISLKASTLKSMGILTTGQVGISYLKSALKKRKEKTLEDFYINSFGEKLYSMFFENYTENLWGRHPSEISPEWGAQRSKGLSITGILKDAMQRTFHVKNREVATSLIEEFSYPKYGPGQMWELTAEEIRRMGGRIVMESLVTGLKRDASGAVTAVIYKQNGKDKEEPCDVVISTMPIKDLVGGMENVPEEYAQIAAGLPYRDYITCGVLLKHLKLKNETDIPTLGNIIPDEWIYVHDRRVHMGRIQIFNNWSPYLVQDPEHQVWIGLEYFCNEGDKMWCMSDEAFARAAVKELIRMGLIDSEEDVLDRHVERVKKAYPAYFDTYDRIDELRAFLDTIPNLYCIGRNGQHRYNNIDHSMCTAFEAVSCILENKTDRSGIWNVNTEKVYHEEHRQD